MTDPDTWAEYDVAQVEALLLEEAVVLRSQKLSARELSLQIICRADDTREMETATHAIRNLREIGLFVDRDDEIVEPTPAACRAVERLT
jgi:predicted MarR family transcription regulator